MNRINANITYVLPPFSGKTPHEIILQSQDYIPFIPQRPLLKAALSSPGSLDTECLYVVLQVYKMLSRHWYFQQTGCSLKGGEYISPQWKETKRNLCVWSGFTFPYILHSCALGFSFSSSRGLCFFTKSVSSWISLLAVSYIFGSVPAAADSFYNQNAITAPMYLNITHVIFCWKDN